MTITIETDSERMTLLSERELERLSNRLRVACESMGVEPSDIQIDDEQD